ncbi:MAG: single-stranded DNA-binding protein [Alphaproteobacteria bacterium]|nr:single-stranded DNA-binding protein [Alphaproteobacteria bacterium]
MNGLNRVDLIGNLGADPEFRSLPGGGEVANFSIATNDGYRDRQNGEYRQQTEWHRIVVFQDGLVAMLRKHAAKGRQAHITGKLRTRKWQDRDGNDRFTTEIVVGPRGSINFLDPRPEQAGDRPPAPPPEAYEMSLAA